MIALGVLGAEYPRCLTALPQWGPTPGQSSADRVDITVPSLWWQKSRVLNLDACRVAVRQATRMRRKDVNPMMDEKTFQQP